MSWSLSGLYANRKGRNADPVCRRDNPIGRDAPPGPPRCEGATLLEEDDLDRLPGALLVEPDGREVDPGGKRSPVIVPAVPFQ